jgi:PAS domain S-box-containing protein
MTPSAVSNIPQDIFRLALEACPNGLVLYDQDNRIVLVNAEIERLFGFDRAELIGSPIGKLLPAGVGANQAGREARDLSMQQPNWQVLGRRKDGTAMPIDVTLRTVQGTVQGAAQVGGSPFVLGLIADSSARLRNDRLKDEFVSTVSHELRTPLTSIAGSLGLLVGRAGGVMPEPAMRLLTIAHKNSERLVRLINDILDIEKIESGQIVFNLARLDAVALAEHAIEANRGFAESLGVWVRMDVAASAVFVRADADRFVQVVINLLSNACKFSPRGEEVVVAIEERPQTVRVTVRDHGPGIPEDFKAHVFKRFAQANLTDARQKGGTGLGLSIVKEITTLLGGAVGFDRAAGGGTIFHVELPRWEPAAFAEPIGGARRIELPAGHCAETGKEVA